MKVHGVVALTLYSNDDGKIAGRTAMQKLVYFTSIKTTSIDIQPYTHYFYGPFSREVATAIEEMTAFSYMNEITRSELYDGYTYELTSKGKKYAEKQASEYPEEKKVIADVVTKCKEFCGLKSKHLSFAAKAHYILEKTQGTESTYDPEDVRRVAKDFDWNLSKSDIKEGIDLLQKLEIVKTS